MQVLITGIAGFVGGHFLEFLRSEHPSVEVIGLVRPGGHRPSAKDLALVEADLEDAASVEAALARIHPDRVIHLAGQASAYQSWVDPEGTLRINVHGLLHLLEALRKRSLSSRVLVVGSAEEYGLVDAEHLPLREDAPLRPHSPYAVSKVAQGYLALQYTLSFGMGIVRTRSFPHTGPGRGEAFAESSFARQIAEIEVGRREGILEVGNLEVVRDFADVRDVVRAYWELLEKGEAGAVYNVCTGKGVRIRDLLDKLIKAAGVDVEVRVDPERLRPSDVPVLVGDPTRLREATGWEARIPLDQTLLEILNDFRERVSAEVLPSSRHRP
jgi:GDP-4-dehydro-6-deoxy-D-mannose reductase